MYRELKRCEAKYGSDRFPLIAQSYYSAGSQMVIAPNGQCVVRFVRLSAGMGCGGMGYDEMRCDAMGWDGMCGADQSESRARRNGQNQALRLGTGLSVATRVRVGVVEVRW